METGDLVGIQKMPHTGLVKKDTGWSTAILMLMALGASWNCLPNMGPEYFQILWF